MRMYNIMNSNFTDGENVILSEELKKILEDQPSGILEETTGVTLTSSGEVISGILESFQQNLETYSLQVGVKEFKTTAKKFFNFSLEKDIEIDISQNQIQGILIEKSVISNLGITGNSYMLGFLIRK